MTTWILSRTSRTSPARRVSGTSSLVKLDVSEGARTPFAGSSASFVGRVLPSGCVAVAAAGEEAFE